MYRSQCVGTALTIAQGFVEALDRGMLTGHPINGCRFVLEDGGAHVQDSSELAFRLAALGAFKEAFNKARPVILEPVMSVEVVAPIEFQGMSAHRGLTRLLNRP
jgi:elongation factor G